MSKKKSALLKTMLAGVLMAALSQQVMAAFSLSGTRFIYEEGAKSISVEVTNSADETYGGQVWVNNTTQSKDKVYMVPSPPFFKVASKSKQILRLMNVNPALPLNQESLFWLNIQEVPPAPKAKDGENVLAIAMNTQVKLIYRPKSLVKGRDDAEKQIKREVRNGRLWLKNPTPYYFAVTAVKMGGKTLKVDDDSRKTLGEFAPYSEVDVGTLSTGKLTVDTINDWGGVQSYDIP